MTRDTDFARWEARCKDYLQGFDAKAQSVAILALLCDEFYDLARSADISAASSPSKALNTLVLEQLVAGIRYPKIRKALLRDRPSTLEKALALAREEEVLQAACEQTPRFCSVSQPSRPTLPTTPSQKRLGSPAPVAHFLGETMASAPDPSTKQAPSPPHH
ncbi:unnamed protein product [Schistocephalus solidus]|uniref:Uncharacterized protein n=1 Tax=Schistocephalus solidus TaxID=70667 RepID=A0A3P7F601_SCHSO|nr:unnamed protein product [Schistocephalus solidus]